MITLLVEVVVEACKGAISFVASVFPKGGIDLKYEVAVLDDEIASFVAFFPIIF